MTSYGGDMFGYFEGDFDCRLHGRGYRPRCHAGHGSVPRVLATLPQPPTVTLTASRASACRRSYRRPPSSSLAISHDAADLPLLEVSAIAPRVAHRRRDSIGDDDVLLMLHAAQPCYWPSSAAGHGQPATARRR